MLQHIGFALDGLLCALLTCCAVLSTGWWVHHTFKQQAVQGRAQDMQLVRMKAVLAVNQYQDFDFDAEIFVMVSMPVQLY